MEETENVVSAPAGGKMGPWLIAPRRRPAATGSKPPADSPVPKTVKEKKAPAEEDSPLKNRLRRERDFNDGAYKSWGNQTNRKLKSGKGCFPEAEKANVNRQGLLNAGTRPFVDVLGKIKVSFVSNTEPGKANGLRQERTERFISEGKKPFGGTKQGGRCE